MAETSFLTAVEPSQEFIDIVLEYIKAHWPVTILDLIDFSRGKFPKTFTRDDVKSFLIKALRILTERCAIDTGLISLEDTEKNVIYPTN